MNQGGLKTMKSILMMLEAAVIALTSVSPVVAAETANPTVPTTGAPSAGVPTASASTAGAPTDAAPAPVENVPMFAQPEGAKRFYVQFELEMIHAYRLSDPSRVDFLQSPGGGDSGAGGASGGG